MAQTKKKRRRRHRGTQAGTIETPGRTGKPVAAERRPATRQTAARQRRENRFDKEPTWRSALNRAAFAAVILAIFIGITQKNIAQGVILGVVAMIIYVPMSYYTDRLLWRRRQRQKQQRSR
jgi:ABC-type xylose transport system permease subunit